MSILENMDNEDQTPEDRVEPWVETPGFAAIALAEQLLEECRKMKVHGRLWSIAATDAQKLVAWISYAVSTFDTE